VPAATALGVLRVRWGVVGLVGVVRMQCRWLLLWEVWRGQGGVRVVALGRGVLGQMGREVTVR